MDVGIGLWQGNACWEILLDRCIDEALCKGVAGTGRASGTLTRSGPPCKPCGTGCASAGTVSRCDVGRRLPLISPCWEITLDESIAGASYEGTIRHWQSQTAHGTPFS